MQQTLGYALLSCLAFFWPPYCPLFGSFIHSRAKRLSTAKENSVMHVSNHKFAS